ncbi:S-adenosyl-L-methionine-dependent methyltransferase [Xylariaceae sp. FL0255]|nr:S-adenosyl-L-methionine-dependent methyltransferase [Xylariaceae sp. FL0255]
MEVTVFQNESAPLEWEDDCDYAMPSGLLVAPSQLNDTPSDTTSRTKECDYLSDQSPSPAQSTFDNRSSAITVDVPYSTLTQPRSAFEGFVPPAPEEREPHAVEMLLEEMGSEFSDEPWIEFELDCFSIYINSKNYPDELRPLQHLTLKNDCATMFFDGTIRNGTRSFFLRRVPFSSLPVGGYGVEEHTVGDQIWIYSDRNKRFGRQVYYKLQSPAPEYQRFHEPFLWVADFTKHVIDYCEELYLKGQHAHLDDFRSRFSIWMIRKHGSSPEFVKWHSCHGTSDFRGALVANIGYLWKEACGLNNETTTWHHFWKEAMSMDYYKPNLETTLGGSKGNDELKTIVTPYVFDLFNHLVFGQMLESKDPVLLTEKSNKNSQAQSGVVRTVKRIHPNQRVCIESIQLGDVISTSPDDENTDTRWKNRPSKHSQRQQHLWFGRVQRVHRHGQNRTSFDVIWLYQSEDTPCSVMRYPWFRELFLSDNCTCHSNGARVRDTQVLGTHDVEWFGNPSTLAEFFVRQTYVTSECSWISLKKDHFICAQAISEPEIPYNAGDAVLAEVDDTFLEPFIIESISTVNDKPIARSRRLWRRREVDVHAPLAPANELVYSKKMVDLPVEMIKRRFLLRLFHIDEKIASPYDRNGTGEACFITHQEIEINGSLGYRPLESISRISETFHQGFDPSKNREIQKLRGFDLFCGGGNFGRGLEDAGAVQMNFCNDIWDSAVHTYMANTEPDKCKPFLGSVDDLLGMALEGNNQVPGPEDVDFISAGSPCPGFSGLTIDRTTPHQRKNQSLVASFAAFVDHYRPLYGLLENVPNMVESESTRDTCVFSQLVCALVGLGYQVQMLFLDAWSFGASQSRTRVFLSFTAPGLQTPKPPVSSHIHPDWVRGEGRGRTSCGLPFNSRKFEPAPFKYVSIHEAVRDLPSIQDGKADYCIGYPDHRLSQGLTRAIRRQLEQIPTHPYGMNFSKAWWGRPGLPPVMTATERQLFQDDGSERTKRSSNGWGRINPNKFVGTLSTRTTPTDARTGVINHWQENRPISIMEARRAQGFLDHEVLIGSPVQQYKIIGNSVSRHVSLALGLSIREAWLGTLLDKSKDVASSTTIQTETSILSTTFRAEAEGTESNSIPESEKERLQFVEEIEETSNLIDLTLDTDSDASDRLSSYTPHSEYLGHFTPSTTLSADSMVVDMSRKRTLPLIVDVLSKKRKQTDVIDLCDTD